MNPVHFSSATPEWATPQDFFDRLNEEFHFTLDVCATPENAKCPFYFTKEDNGLRQHWTGVCWVNPPYGRVISDWVKKSVFAALSGCTVVALLPARTDTKWFQDWVLPYAELRFVRGRLKFGGAKNSAPFPSVVAVYRGAK